MKIILTDTFISDRALSYIRLFPTVPLNTVQWHHARKTPLGKGMGEELLFKDVTLCWFNLILSKF